MKKLILPLFLCVTLFSCSRDEDRNYSAVENFVGQWELQSRVLDNTTPVPTDDEKLIFRDDTDIRDFKGIFTLETTEITSGTFSITDQGDVLNFEASNGTTISYRFILNTITLNFSGINEDGDLIDEVWTKVSNFVD